MANNKAYLLKKDVLITTIIEECPRAVDLLAEYGLLCFTCALNRFDTLEIGAKIHGLTPEDVSYMINDINAQLKREAANNK